MSHSKPKVVNMAHLTTSVDLTQLATRQGIEPRLIVPKTIVLPLDDRVMVIWTYNCITICQALLLSRNYSMSPAHDTTSEVCTALYPN